MKTARGAVLTAVLFLPCAASAGQRPFIWAYDTNIVSTGNIELEQWLWAEGPTTAAGSNPDYWVWWGPVVGATSHLEVAVPFQIHSSGTTTSLASFDADFRFRLFAQDDRDGFQALLRVAWHQSLYSEPSRIDFNLSTSYGNAAELHLVGEIGGQIPVTNTTPNTFVIGTYDVGASYPVVHSLTALQVAAEVYGEVFFNTPTVKGGPPNLWVGPVVAWSGTRFWATLGVLVPLTPTSQTPEYLTRLVWAVAL